MGKQITSIINWGIFGHEGQKQVLERQLLTGQLQGFYLFCGPAHVGKTAVATTFAQALVCQGRMESGQTRPCFGCFVCRIPAESNPDLEIFDEPGEIKVSKVRDWLKKFSLKSFSGGRRTLVLGGAENLNLEAANALLKFLEEPDSQTTVFMTTSRASALPLTILSRAHKLFFGMPEPDAVEKFYAGYPEVSSARKQAIRRICASRLGIAARAFASQVYADSLINSIAEFEQVLVADTIRRLEYSASVADLEPAEIDARLVEWLIFSLNHRLSQAVEKHALPKVGRQMAQLSQAIRHFAQNLNRKLVLDNLFLNL